MNVRGVNVRGVCVLIPFFFFRDVALSYPMVQTLKSAGISRTTTAWHTTLQHKTAQAPLYEEDIVLVNVDMNSLKPIPFDPEFAAKFSRYCDNNVIPRITSPSKPSGDGGEFHSETGIFHCKRQAMWSDIDHLDHVNQTNYLKFCLDTASLAKIGTRSVRGNDCHGHHVWHNNSNACCCGPQCQCGDSNACRCGPECQCSDDTACHCGPHYQCGDDNECRCGSQCQCSDGNACQCGSLCQCSDGNACQCGSQCQCDDANACRCGSQCQCMDGNACCRGPQCQCSDGNAYRRGPQCQCSEGNACHCGPQCQCSEGNA